MKCNATLIHQVMSVTETSTTSNIAGEWDSEWKGPKEDFKVRDSASNYASGVTGTVPFCQFV